MGRKATLALLAALGLLLTAEFFFSLKWRMEHDSPILLYLAWLIDRRHLVPYRDLFDVNTPATYALYALVGRVFGYGDLGFRVADLTMLTAILATMWFWMRRFGAACAWCAVFCFGLLFLRLGVQGGLQRDFVLILPISASVLIAAGSRRSVSRTFAIGLLFGIAASIKPQAAIGLPVALWFCLRQSDPPGKSQVAWPLLAGLSVAGFALPLAATCFYLLRVGALGSFLDIARNYWPLYGRLASNTHAVAGPAGAVVRGLFLLQGIASFGPYAVWALAAVAGVLTVLRSRPSTRTRHAVCPADRRNGHRLCDLPCLWRPVLGLPLAAVYVLRGRGRVAVSCRARRTAPSDGSPAARADARSGCSDHDPPTRHLP